MCASDRNGLDDADERTASADERFEVRQAVLRTLIETVVGVSPFDSYEEARAAGWAFSLNDLRMAHGSRSGDGPEYELYDFAYLLSGTQAYIRPPGFGMKAIFPVVQPEVDRAGGFRVEVCVDGASAVRSPRFEASVVVGPSPADFDESVAKVHEVAGLLARWGTYLIPAARAFARRD